MNTEEATYIHDDLQPGMTIAWWDDPDHLDVVAVSEPDAEGMVTIDAAQGRFRWGGDCMFTEITPGLADMMGLVVAAESSRLASGVYP